MSRILVLDGAMATLRLQTGLDAAAIHRAYLAAGADIISTDTFMAANDHECFAAARTARAAVDEQERLTPEHPRLVAGVLSATTGGVRGLIDGGVDLLLAETLASLAQVTAALDAVARERDAPPLMISVAVTARGLLPSSDTIDDVANAVSGASLFSIGCNCGSGIDGLRQPLEALARLSRVRVSCQPTAGLPDAFGNYDEPLALTAAFLHDAAREGLLDIAGGCCGTTPATIAAIAQAVRGLPARMTGFRE